VLSFDQLLVLNVPTFRVSLHVSYVNQFFLFDFAVDRLNPTPCLAIFAGEFRLVPVFTAAPFSRHPFPVAKAPWNRS
jgi:hypothetical protein